MDLSSKSGRIKSCNHLNVLGLLALCVLPYCEPALVHETEDGAQQQNMATIRQELKDNQQADVIILLDNDNFLAGIAQQQSNLIDNANHESTTTSAFDMARVNDRLNRVLQDIPQESVAEIHRYEQLPMRHVRVSSEQALLAIEKNLSSDVKVYPNSKHRHYLKQSLSLIRQPEVISNSQKGKGTAVAVLDTGLNYKHADFGTCSKPGVAGCKVAEMVEIAKEDNNLDADGHGTNVAAIVLGVAPETKVIGMDVFNGEYSYSSDILSAIDWVLNNRTRYNIVAMNLSLGGDKFTSNCDNSVYASAFRRARNAGVIPVVAAGNEGYKDALSAPACVSSAISVGAVYDADVGGLDYGDCNDKTTRVDQVTCFSNSASFLSILAPGALITAGGFEMAGTSQASPHVAGAVALVRAEFPKETSENCLNRILSSKDLIKDLRNNITKPRLNVALALANTTTPVKDTTPPTGSVIINQKAAYTSTTAVKLTLSAQDSSGVKEMCISTTTKCTQFVPYATSAHLTLTGNDGVNSVYVVFKDTVGNVNATPYQASITLDRVAPTEGQFQLTALNSTQIQAKWSGFADKTSGLDAYVLMYSNKSAPASCTQGVPLYQGTAVSYVHKITRDKKTTHYYLLCAKDKAGLVSKGLVRSIQ